MSEWWLGFLSGTAFGVALSVSALVLWWQWLKSL